MPNPGTENRRKTFAGILEKEKILPNQTIRKSKTNTGLIQRKPILGLGSFRRRNHAEN